MRLQHSVNQMLTIERCLKFRKIIMDFTDVDPFRISITIAGLCNYILRKKHLKSQTIALIPHNGYNSSEITSIKCQMWLKYLSEKNNIFIQHARNLGEFKVGRFRVDGYCQETKTIYELKFVDECECIVESFF